MLYVGAFGIRRVRVNSIRSKLGLRQVTNVRGIGYCESYKGAG
jgi:hypothetical protein